MALLQSMMGDECDDDADGEYLAEDHYDDDDYDDRNASEQDCTLGVHCREKSRRWSSVGPADG